MRPSDWCGRRRGPCPCPFLSRPDRRGRRGRRPRSPRRRGSRPGRSRRRRRRPRRRARERRAATPVRGPQAAARGVIRTETRRRA
ncbi:hypothetical protein EAO70_04225 [Streptomyces sp. adm13(2018)]|nr:hypothetical protein EAO70_04225 [Streptomyces sp. adm13(2018)]